MEKTSIIIVSDEIFENIIVLKDILSVGDKSFDDVSFIKKSKIAENFQILSQAEKCFFLYGVLNNENADSEHEIITSFYSNCSTKAKWFIFCLCEDYKTLHNKNFVLKEYDESCDSNVYRFAILKSKKDILYSLVDELALCSAYLNRKNDRIDFNCDYISSEVTLNKRNLNFVSGYYFFKLNQKIDDLKALIQENKKQITNLKARKPKKYGIAFDPQEDTSTDEVTFDSCEAMYKRAIDITAENAQKVDVDIRLAQNEITRVEIAGDNASDVSPHLKVEMQEANEFLPTPDDLVEKVTDINHFNLKKLLAASDLFDTYKKNEGVNIISTLKIALFTFALFAFAVYSVYIEKIITKTATLTKNDYLILFIVPIVILLVCFGIYVIFELIYNKKAESFLKDITDLFKQYVSSINDSVSPRRKYINKYVTVYMNTFFGETKIRRLEKRNADLEKEVKNLTATYEKYFAVINCFLDKEQLINDVSALKEKESVIKLLEDYKQNVERAGSLSTSFTESSYWITKIVLDQVATNLE